MANMFTLGDRVPRIAAPHNFIAHNASIIGTVHIEVGATVWFNVVIRGDSEQLTIGENTNVQDGAVLHADPGFPLLLGKGVTVGHLAMLHGCTVGDNSLIGIRALVMNGAKVGKNCIIGAGALVPEGKEVPDNSLVMGSPFKVVRETTPDERAHLTRIAQGYVARGQRYQRELFPYSATPPSLASGDGP
jgi:carbonic anhydrase/acetyltransferase-like protein (isoleucine patch superfamily)